MFRIIRREEGSIAILGAILLSAMVGCAAMAIEMGNWYLSRTQLQRAADLAAIAGAFTYANNQNWQGATGAAADTAELNGASGGTRSSDSGLLSLSDGKITAQLVDSPRTATNKAVEVRVSQDIPILLAEVVGFGGGAVSISAAAWAEITPPTAGGQPCVLSLSQTGAGLNTGLNIGGNPTLALNGCTLRSDSGVDVYGSANVTAEGVYAAGDVSGTSMITTTPAPGQIFADAGIIADPYAGNSAVQAAFDALKTATGPSLSVQPSQSADLTPGLYSGLDIKGTATLAPGTYIVNGPITFDSQAVINGTGVTIIASGPVVVNGGATVNLSAPVAGASSGIPGVVLASNSTDTSGNNKLNGGSSAAFQGAIYFPKANISFTGNSMNGQSGCTQIIANTVTFSGSATLAANCDGLGTAKFSSTGSGVALVQ